MNRLASPVTFLILVVAMLLLLGAVNAGANGGRNLTIQSETDPASLEPTAVGGSGRWSRLDHSLFFDQENRPHVLNGAYHVWFDGNVWHIQGFDPPVPDAKSLVVELNSLGRPHVLYVLTHTSPTASPYDELWYAAWTGQGWLTRLVYTYSTWGITWAVLKLDPTGCPHIIYDDADTQRIMYATILSGRIVLESLPYATPEWSTPASLVIGEDSSLHLLYATAQGLAYAERDSAAWRSTLLNVNGADPSLTLDRTGRPHVSYSRLAPQWGGVGYATRSGDAWSYETPIPSEPATESTSIAVDGAGNIYISFLEISYDYDGRSGRWLQQFSPRIVVGNGQTWESPHWLGYSSIWNNGTSVAVDAVGVWHVVFWSDYHDNGKAYSVLQMASAADDPGDALTIVPPGGEVQNLKIAIGADQQPWIAYDDFNVLKLSRREATGWDTQLLRSGGFVQLGALDLANGTDPVIAYSDYTKPTILSWTTGRWLESRIDDGAVVSGEMALALDSHGRLNVVYYDQAKADLIYALRQGARWITSTVVSTGDVGRYPDLLMAPAGELHASYFDQTSWQARHATLMNGVWQTEAVAGDGGHFSSLGSGPLGQLRLAYLDYVHSNIMYARRTADGWRSEVVDKDGGGFISLAVDGAGNPHLAYARQELLYVQRMSGQWSVSQLDRGNVGGYCDRCG